VAFLPLSTKPSYQDEYNILERFPKCDASERPFQVENDCYAHAPSLAYSLRNCITQYDKVIPDVDNIMVRTVDNGRNATFPDGHPCGNGKNGGYSSCVSAYFERTDKNPVKLLEEKKVEEELLRKGPVTVTFDTRKDFFEHISKTGEPYKPNPQLRQIGRHATTIVGFGCTHDGRKYWLCHDSNIGNDGQFFNYRLMNADPLLKLQFIGQEIKHPLPFTEKKREQQHFVEMGEIPHERYWTGALRDDHSILIKSGLEKGPVFLSLFPQRHF